MTEEIAATPGWVDTRLDALFASIGDVPGAGSARRTYLDCLASRKAPAAPSDTLGAEFAGCADAVRRALIEGGADASRCADLLAGLERLEAEIAGES